MKLRAEYRRFHYAFFCALIPCAILTLGLFALFFAAFKSGATIPISYWFASLPGKLRAFFYVLSPVDMSDPLCFFIRFYQPIYFLETLIICIIAGCALNSDECKLGELWFTLPVSRTNIFVRRYIGTLLLVLLLNLTLLILSVICYTIMFVPDMSYIAAFSVIFIRIAIVEGILCSTGIFYSSLTKNSRQSALWSVLTFLATWALSILPSFFGIGNRLMYAALPYYAIPEYSLRVGLHYNYFEGSAFTLVFALFTVLGLMSYRKKEYRLEG